MWLPVEFLEWFEMCFVGGLACLIVITLILLAWRVWNDLYKDT